jgi:hypothetical protein
MPEFPIWAGTQGQGDPRHIGATADHKNRINLTGGILAWANEVKPNGRKAWRQVRITALIS